MANFVITTSKNNLLVRARCAHVLEYAMKTNVSNVSNMVSNFKIHLTYPRCLNCDAKLQRTKSFISSPSMARKQPRCSTNSPKSAIPKKRQLCTKTGHFIAMAPFQFSLFATPVFTTRARLIILTASSLTIVIRLPKSLCGGVLVVKRHAT